MSLARLRIVTLLFVELLAVLDAPKFDFVEFITRRRRDLRKTARRLSAR